MGFLRSTSARCVLVFAIVLVGFFSLTAQVALSQSTASFNASSFLFAPTAAVCVDCADNPLLVRFDNPQITGSSLTFVVQARLANAPSADNFLTSTSLYFSESEDGGLSDVSGNLTCMVAASGISAGFDLVQRVRGDGSYFASLRSSSFSSLQSAVSSPTITFASSDLTDEYQDIAAVSCDIEDSTAGSVANLGLDALSWNQSFRYDTAGNTIPDNPLVHQQYSVTAENDLLRVDLSGQIYVADVRLHSDGGGVDLVFSADTAVTGGDFLVFQDSLGGNLALLTETASSASYARSDAAVVRVDLGGGQFFTAGTTTVVRTAADDSVGDLLQGQELVRFVYDDGAPYIDLALLSGSNSTLTVVFNEDVSTLTISDFILGLNITDSAGVQGISMSSVTEDTSASRSTYEVGLVYTGSAPSPGQVDAGQGDVVATGAERLNLRTRRFAVRDGAGDTAYEVQTMTDNIPLSDTKAPEFSRAFELSNLPFLTVTATDISGVDLMYSSTFTETGSTVDASFCQARGDYMRPSASSDSVTIFFSASVLDNTYICFRAEDQSTNGNLAYLAVELQKESAAPIISMVGIMPSTVTMLYASFRTLTIEAQDEDSGLASVGYRSSTNRSTVCSSGTEVDLSSGFSSGAGSAVVADVFSYATVDPFYVCAFAVDISGNVTSATGMVRLVTNIDPDAPEIMIAGPSTAVAQSATIMGNVSSAETTSSGVSGLASFGYAELASADSCTSVTALTTTATDSAVNPGEVLSLTTSTNGVSLCFVAVDNAGNVTVRRSVETENLDNMAPVHPGAVVISNENTAITITYSGSNPIMLTDATSDTVHHGITVSVVNGDSIRDVVITSTPSIAGMDLVIPVEPGAGDFRLDGVGEVLVEGVGTGSPVALSRYGSESYVVTIPGGVVADIVGNVDNNTEVSTSMVEENADAVLVTLGERTAGAPSTVTAVISGRSATTASFTMNIFFSEVVTDPSEITADDFRVYRIGSATALSTATTGDSVQTITPTSLQVSLTADSSNTSETSIDLVFSEIPYVSANTGGYLVSFINDGTAAGGCYSDSSVVGDGYPHPNASIGDECVGTSVVEVVSSPAGGTVFNIRVFLGGALE